MDKVNPAIHPANIDQQKKRSSSPASFFEPFHSSSDSSFFPSGNNSAKKPFFQCSLDIGHMDDPYEKEAEAMEDQIVEAPEKKMGEVKPPSANIQRKNALEEGEELQRKCAACEEETPVQMKSEVPAGPGAEAPPIVRNAINSTGHPLDKGAKSFFETRFGHDFSNVRIHAGSLATESAKSINATAYTHKNDIVFGSGQYQPETVSGKKLLAHELTHVVQQEGGTRLVDTPVQLSVASTGEELQRQPAPQPARAEIKFRMGWFTDEGTPVETNGEIAAVARLTIASLEGELGDIESAVVKAQVTEWIATVKGVLPYFVLHAGEKVDPDFIPLINYQYDKLVQVRADIYQDKLIQIKEALWREHDAAVKAAEEAEALQPALDDAMRAAYRKGSSSSVKDVVSTVKGALSVGRNLRTLAAEITKDIMRLSLASGTKIFVDTWTSQIGTPRITIINVGKYTDKLGKLGRGLSALSVILTIADRNKKATEAEQGMKDLTDAVGIGTDLISASPLSMPPHFSLYSTLYLKPALKVIAKQLGILVENLSDINRAAVEVTGDLMYPNAEPGGQEMFDLMVKVMHAGNESGFPVLSDGVKEYLFDHREKLSAGAESDVPTEGSLFWKDLDIPAGRRWLFAHRKRVWAMFYGSMNVPDSKH